MSATVIIPTTGEKELHQAIKSVLNQTYKDTLCYVVCDGNDYAGKVKPIIDNYRGNKNLNVCYLPLNVGSNGYYGHRVYAAFTHLINTEYVLYLDQDNWFEPNHVKNCIETIKNGKLDWSYSLRKIVETNGDYICNDDCESLGKWNGFTEYSHIDTNCYCIKTDVANKLSQVWHGGWGQDRIFFAAIAQYFKSFDCSKEYSVNYRIGGNAGSVKKEFFAHGNAKMESLYKVKFPRRK